MNEVRFLNKRLKKQVTNFMKCGLMGWGLECLWTGCGSLCAGKDKKMHCETSMWMFPIYGMAVFLIPVYQKIKEWPTILRGIVYGFCIIGTEFITGTILKFFHVCPWDYTGKLLSFHGIIRLDYFPFWFAVGLIYEQLLCEPLPPLPRISFLQHAKDS